MKTDMELRKSEINDWLKNTPGDFNSGFELFLKYSGNVSLQSLIKRKKDLKLLTYQLKKLIGIHLLPVQGSDDIQVRELKLSKGDAPADNPAQSFDLPDEIKAKYEKVDRKILPGALQVIHDQVAEAYKFQRSYHEKMKLAETDIERAELRAKDIEYDDIIAKGWDAIDSFLKDGPQDPGVPAEKTALEISNSINAARSYITKNLNSLPTIAEKKKSARIIEIKKRVDVLISLKAPVKQETFNALLQSGIISDSSGLVIETR
jgi:hypothetical protein